MISSTAMSLQMRSISRSVSRSPTRLAPATTYIFNPEDTFAENPTLRGWKSFDGVYSIDSSSPVPYSFLLGELSTSAAGDISTWAFTIGTAADGPDEVALSEGSCYQVVPCSNILVPSGFSDYVQVAPWQGPYTASAASDSAGTWTMSLRSTPEPSSLSLLLLGMPLSLICAGRRRDTQLSAKTRRTRVAGTPANYDTKFSMEGFLLPAHYPGA